MINRDLVDRVRMALAARADPVRAPGMQAYMKSEMPYLGVTSTPMRDAVRELLPADRLGSFEDWRDTIVALWDEARYREERYAALALIGHPVSRQFRTLDALPLYAQLIVSGAWWDLVDGLATHEVGDLLKRYPQPMRQTMLDWSRDADPWLRRTSIICQVGFKTATDQALLYACIEPNLSERGFFLRKAIGWALREYAKTAPEAVRQYVAENESRLSGLSRRQALKHLEPKSSTPGGVPVGLQFGAASA
jgi:3-methyladenine DNA glycosylase AlkD